MSPPLEEVSTALRKGAHMIKYGNYGEPRETFVVVELTQIGPQLKYISKKSKGDRLIPFSAITTLRKGLYSEKFRRFKKSPDDPDASRALTVEYNNRAGSKQTLDLLCDTADNRDLWFEGLKVLVDEGWFPLDSVGDVARARAHSIHGGMHVGGSSVDGDGIGEVGGLHILRTKAALGMPLAHEVGDCYFWGKAEASNREGLHPANSPQLIRDCGKLDVYMVSCGPHHAALLTNRLELYTWGSNEYGALGNGSLFGRSAPSQLTQMTGQGIQFVACGDTCTAVFNRRGEVFTWGEGQSGQLGQGYTNKSYLPRQIFTGLDGHIAIQVSCGPYHTAVVTSSGLLLTWGDGFCGKLGHGSMDSAQTPRVVDALRDKFVLAVSCGTWHTACVAEERSGEELKFSKSETQLSDFTIQSDLIPALDDPLSLSPLVEYNEHGHNGAHTNTHDMHDMSDMHGVHAMVAADRSQQQYRPRTSRQATRASVASSSAGYYGLHGVASGGIGSGMAGGYGAGGYVASEIGGLEGRDVALEMGDEEEDGGQLYTWGGAFTWVERKITKPNQEGGQGKKDDHKGCLGVGDKEGRLLPTHVPLPSGQKARQVACGLNLTLIITSSGGVLQCGTTGANVKSGDAPWDGSKVPIAVEGPLYDMYAEQVAVGNSHVVLIATPLVDGERQQGGELSHVYSWGQGADGQLGLGNNSDQGMPQRVLGLQGKKALQVRY